MNQELIINSDACYKMAEQKAAEYFQSLSVECEQKSFVSTLTNDLQSWKQNHIHSVFPFFHAEREGQMQRSIKNISNGWITLAN